MDLPFELELIGESPTKIQVVRQIVARLQKLTPERINYEYH
jgi:hypothetical protein